MKTPAQCHADRKALILKARWLTPQGRAYAEELSKIELKLWNSPLGLKSRKLKSKVMKKFYRDTDHMYPRLNRSISRG